MKSENLVLGEKWFREAGFNHVWARDGIELSWDKKQKIWVACCGGKKLSNSEIPEEAWTRAKQKLLDTSLR